MNGEPQSPSSRSTVEWELQNEHTKPLHVRMEGTVSSFG